ncbi:MAG: ATP/GTP-binding protein [Nitrososphaeria archaeon]|nr:ATP/GTP-binding protein [Conexivisphaerales archaeon]
MNYIFVTGLAGSGKSLLTSVLSDSLEDDGWGVARVNLDPSAETIPYTPDYDIREFIDSRTIYEKYGLGSNGALIFAMDLLAGNLQAFMPVLESFDLDFAVIDMPGQLEIFTFRQSGPFLLNSISREDKLVLFLSDITASFDFQNFILAEIMARVLSARTNAPTIHVINKVDVSPQDAERIRGFLEIKSADELNSLNEKHLFNAYKHIQRIAPETTHVFASAKTKENIWQIKAYITRAFRGGEDKKE